MVLLDTYDDTETNDPTRKSVSRLLIKFSFVYTLDFLYFWHFYNNQKVRPTFVIRCRMRRQTLSSNRPAWAPYNEYISMTEVSKTSAYINHNVRMCYSFLIHLVVALTSYTLPVYIAHSINDTVGRYFFFEFVVDSAALEFRRLKLVAMVFRFAINCNFYAPFNLSMIYTILYKIFNSTTVIYCVACVLVSSDAFWILFRILPKTPTINTILASLLEMHLSATNSRHHWAFA